MIYEHNQFGDEAPSTFTSACWTHAHLCRDQLKWQARGGALHNLAQRRDSSLAAPIARYILQA